MSERVDPKLMDELKELGALNVSACYSCGVCTATCPLSEEGHEFPRRIIRYAVLGLKDRLLSSTEPWLCYYCGECTKTCPRGADPAGFMMAVRRYLTTQYDFTGFSKLLYKSKTIEVISAIILFSLTALGIYLLHGPIILTGVDLNTFLSPHLVETVDKTMMVILSLLLLVNIYRMYRFTVRINDGGKLPFTTYVLEFIKTVVTHFLTQKRMLKCSDNVLNWAMHILIVYGYATVFILVVIFLDLFQTNIMYPVNNPIRLAGYIAAAALIAGSGYGIYGRIRKNTIMRQYSHHTDWMFIILIFLLAVTGVLVDVFKYLGLPMETYITYAIHLSLEPPFVILMIPFGKWSHLAYRPFAIYFTRLNDLARKKPLEVVGSDSIKI